MNKNNKYNNIFHVLGEMKTYLFLWSTQSFSGLGMRCKIGRASCRERV